MVPRNHVASRLAVLFHKILLGGKGRPDAQGFLHDDSGCGATKSL